MFIESEVENFLLPSSSFPSTIMTGDTRQHSHNSHEHEYCSWKHVETTANISILSSKSFNSNSNSLEKMETSIPLSNPKVEDMQYWVVAAILFIFVRIIVERYIFIPLGKRLGLKDRPPFKIPCRIPSAVSLLEMAYVSGQTKLTSGLINKLCADTGMKSREIERWFRKRRTLDKPSKLIKFSESGWRFVCYVMSTTIGIWALLGKPWVWDAEICWANYPNHDLPTEIWLYYLYASGLYLSFLMTQAFDVKRKDFWEMFAHHIITLGLLTTSWIMNFTRIGIFTIILHDCADVFLEAAKMANYAKKQNLSTGIFFIFTLVWIVTRLMIYPKKVVIETGLQMFIIENVSKAVVILLAVLLVTLLGLHIFWTYFICKVAISALKGHEKQKDARSSTESDSTDEDETLKTLFTLENREKIRKRNQEKKAFKRFSLQIDDGTQLLARINTKQRAVMRRISLEFL